MYVSYKYYCTVLVFALCVVEAARGSHADLDFEVVVAKTSGEFDLLVAATSPFAGVLCLSGRFLDDPFLVKGGESEIAAAL